MTATTMTTTRYIMTDTAMKTLKTNGVLLGNCEIHGEFMVIPSFRKHVCGRHSLWLSLWKPFWGMCIFMPCRGTHYLPWKNEDCPCLGTFTSISRFGFFIILLLITWWNLDVVSLLFDWYVTRQCMRRSQLAKTHFHRIKSIQIRICWTIKVIWPNCLN